MKEQTFEQILTFFIIVVVSLFIFDCSGFFDRDNNLEKMKSK